MRRKTTLARWRRTADMTDCDAKFRQHHATLEAGADPAHRGRPAVVRYVRKTVSEWALTYNGDFPSPGEIMQLG